MHYAVHTYIEGRGHACCKVIGRKRPISGLTVPSAKFNYVGGHFEFTRCGSLQPVRVLESRRGCLVTGVE